MPWIIEVNTALPGERPQWRAVHAIDHPPRKYATKDEAERVAEDSYPEQKEAERSGCEIVVRVKEVP